MTIRATSRKHGASPQPSTIPTFQRRLLLPALAALIAAGVGWWSTHRQPASELALDTAAQPSEERALRAAAVRAPRDAEAQRAVGVYLLAHRRPYEAMWAFQDTLELRPEDNESRRGLARALIVARLPRRALEVLADQPTSTGTAAAASVEGGDELENRRVAAAAYLTAGDPLGAVTMLEAVGPALRGSPAALLDLGNAYEALGDDDAAGSAYQQLVKQQPDHVDGQLALARVAVRRGSWGEAFPALARAQMLAPSDPRPAYRHALALRERGGPLARSEQTGGAIDGLRRVVQAHPDFGPAHRQLGLWYLRTGRPDAAVESLQRAVAARSGGSAARLELARALSAAGRKADAVYQRGRYFEAAQQLDLAVREYQRLARLDPQRKDVSLLLSGVYNLMDQNEPAVDAVEADLGRHPDDLSLRTRYGLLLMMTDQSNKAAALCRRWMKERPDWAEPHHLLARMEREALRPADAARHAEKAMALDPRNAEYCLEAARAQIALRNTGGLRRALITLRRGLSLDPKHAEMHLRLGEVLERLDDLDGARLHYLRSMDHERNVRFGAYSLSQLCPRLKRASRTRFYAENVRVLREREDAATTLWRRVYDDPADAETHATLADLLLQAGDTDQALHQLLQSVRLRPDPKRTQQIRVLQRLHEMREG